MCHIKHKRDAPGSQTIGGKKMKLIVYGTPTPKGRPRVTMRGKFPIVYTPKETREAEDTFVAQIIKHRPETPIEGPLKVDIKFFKLKPKSMKKSITHWTTKPDLDNLVKLAIDAVNKIFFRDDSQIVEITASKYYDKTPRTELEIRKV